MKTTTRKRANTWQRCVLALAVAGGAASPSVAADAPPGASVETVLGTHVTPDFRSDVMVFGTLHLSAFRDWLQPAHLQDTLAALERFAPTRIAVERIPPDEIALLIERAAHDPSAQRVLDQFAGPIVVHGRALQHALGLERVAASRAADGLLADASAAMSDAARLMLVAQLLAAFEFDSAALQWSYLSTGAQADAAMLPVEVREALDRRLLATDEIARVAMPLARALGLQRLYPVDSQYELVRTFGLPAEALGNASETAWGEAWTSSAARQAIDDAQHRARETGDLLGLIGYLNSAEGQRHDAAQWTGWMTQARTDGVDRFRYAMWELRNQRMSSYVLDATVSTRPERLLFMVGNSHKSFVERALAPQLGIRLVQPDAATRAPH